MSEIMQTVKIWTDGACMPNPGNGAWAALLECEGKRKLISGPMEGQQTNNRAELMAMIAALEALKRPCVVKLVSDSRYALNVASGEWNGSSNWDLIERLRKLGSIHQVSWIWKREFSTSEQTTVHNEADAQALRIV